MFDNILENLNSNLRLHVRLHMLRIMKLTYNGRNVARGKVQHLFGAHRRMTLRLDLLLRLMVLTDEEAVGE